MRYLIWCEVNRAWKEACLVWLYSLCRELCFCEHDVKVVIFYDVDKTSADNDDTNTTSFSNRVQQLGMRFNVEVEVELFDSREFTSDLPDNFCEGRCIDKNSVGIAISRLMNYNKLLSYTDNQIQPMMLSAESHNVINSNLRICNPNNPTDAENCSDNGVVYIHCDIDGIFLEDSNLELLFDGIDSVIADNDSPLLIGVNEYDDIEPALAKTHSEEFMTRLQGVYLNCGFICFYNVPAFDLAELKDFLSTEDSYCLEQDYLNLLGCDNTNNPSLTRICLQPQYNYTYRKMLMETKLDTQTEPQSQSSTSPFTLPVFVHYYGSDKPFLPNPKSTNGIDSDVTPAIAHYYFPEYGQLVFKIRCLLSVDFVNLVRKRCVEEYWSER
ncbi:MAG: hypothetical protein VZR27_09880 [Acutalibacteraceae bacterium]|nr:hypothetical protein [Acutalibacteraceae bacterium]